MPSFRVLGLCEGDITQLDSRGKSISMAAQVERRGGQQRRVVTFILDPSVWVTTRVGGTLTLAHLEVGQRVIIHYDTRPVGRRVVQKIVIVEPMAQPKAPIPRTQVAR